MVGYESAMAHVTYCGDGMAERFYLFFRTADANRFLYVYVPDFKIQQNPSLRWVHEVKDRADDGGYAVSLAQWDYRTAAPRTL